MSILNSPAQVIFASNDINQVPGLIILTRDIFTDGVRNINFQKLARVDKSILTTAEYASKLITISVAIVRDSRAELESASDLLNSLVQDIEGTLQITQNGQTRNYIATLQSTSVDSVEGGFMQKTLVFLCSDPFGYDTNQSTLIDTTTITTTTSTLQMVVGGSFKVAPTFTIVVTAVTGGSAASISITNSQTGIGVTITRDFVAGDIIGIDGPNGIITVNGATFNATGKIPLFTPGLRQVGYVDTFTTRTVTLGAVCINKYL